MHAHVLVWLRRKRAPPGWEPLQPVPKLGNATCQRQRPSTQVIQPLKPEEGQEDTLYQLSEAGRVTAEMARPDVSGPSWGGYADVSRLRIAALARSIQYRIPYLHSCTPAYCLKDRSSCRRPLAITVPDHRKRIAKTRPELGWRGCFLPRFFYPWPYQPYQAPRNFDNVRLRTGIGERTGPCMLRRKLVQGSGGVPCDMLRTVVSL